MAETLTCPACRASQPGRRGEPLCPACTQAAAEEVPPSPSWVLDSPLLRRMLAETNVPAVLAVVRSACGLSQRDMAAVAGWSPAALSYYERGRRDAVFDVRVLLQFADAVGMPRGSLLALVLGDPDAVRAGSAMAPAVPCGSGPGSAGGARLRYWRACTDALYRKEDKADGTGLLDPALLLWHQARRACGRQDPGAEELAVTAAGTALCAARFALDSGDLPLGRSLHEAARGLAARARDTMLNVQVLTAGSRLYAEIARTGRRDVARQAMALAREAAEEGRYLPVPGLHALIAVRQAEAAALLGDSVVFGTSIARARRELDRAVPGVGEPLPMWLRHVDHAYVTAEEERQRGCLTASVKALHTASGNTSRPPAGWAESRTIA